MSVHRSRYEPGAELRDHDIPCLVWFEDAISPYGVPTEVFDLHLLVPDIDDAARALMDKGWTDAGPSKSSYDFLMGPIPQRRLNPPDTTAPGTAPLVPSFKDPPEPTLTVLLPAAYWKVSVDDLRPCSPGGFVPPLPVLIDALIDSFLDSTPGLLQTRLATHVAYVYGHCKSLKTQDFAEQLKLEHRQFHYDALSKPGTGTMLFLEEQRRIRGEIREGKRQPQRNTWYLPPREKEVIPRASGWDGDFQAVLGETLEKRVYVDWGVEDAGSLVSGGVELDGGALVDVTR
jgi:hypothetical protein